MPPTITESSAFACLGLSSKVLKTVESNGFTVPTPIQERAIPVALRGQDVLGIAQTGTGKTLAFGLPIIERLMAKGGQALIMVPTRELALQVEETIQKIGRVHGMRTAVLIGGAPMGRQIAQIRARPHIIVATPGRIKDHLYQKTLILNQVNVVVLDEADRMLDMGFAPVIKEILSNVPKARQTMLFSATMPGEIVAIANSYMVDPERIEIARAGTLTELVSQELYVVNQEDKGSLLEKLLYDYKGTILVFARTRHGARKIARSVRLMGHEAAELHADRTLAQRRAALDGFKRGDYRVLVATDIAARGIDVKQIEVVINYDLPDNPDDYVHRIGRTGRAGETGHAITIATPDQSKDVRDIERVLRVPLQLSPKSPLQLASASHRPAPRPNAGARHARSMSAARPSGGRPQGPRGRATHSGRR